MRRSCRPSKVSSTMAADNMSPSLPRVFLRGGSWCADLRRLGGTDKHALGVGVEATPVEVGVALARKMDELSLGARVANPMLPGMDSPGLKISELVAMYRDGRDEASAGGGRYLDDYCGYVTKGIGHLSVLDLSAPQGETVLRAWRNELWKAGWRPRSVRNVLNLTRAVLVWGQS